MIVLETQTTSAMNKILLSALDQLAVHQGLTVPQIAVRCVLTGKVPSTPAFSREVVNAYQKLEAELTRGIGSWSGREVV